MSRPPPLELLQAAAPPAPGHIIPMSHPPYTCYNTSAPQPLAHFTTQAAASPQPTAIHSMPRQGRRGGGGGPALIHCRKGRGSTGPPGPPHTWLTSYGAPVGTFAVIDPSSKRLFIPLSAMRETRALHRQGVPSLCCIFMEGRCRQGANCFQAHADAAVVEQLRAEALRQPTCCPLHGATTPSHAAQQVPPTLLISVMRDRTMEGGANTSSPGTPEGLAVGMAGLSPQHLLVTIPLARVSWTVGLRVLLHAQYPNLANAAPPPDAPPLQLYVPSSALCLLHLQQRGTACCRFEADCKFIHVCRQALREAGLLQHLRAAGEQQQQQQQQAPPPPLLPVATSPLGGVVVLDPARAGYAPPNQVPMQNTALSQPPQQAIHARYSAPHPAGPSPLAPKPEVVGSSSSWALGNAGVTSSSSHSSTNPKPAAASGARGVIDTSGRSGRSFLSAPPLPSSSSSSGHSHGALRRHVPRYHVLPTQHTSPDFGQRSSSSSSGWRHNAPAALSPTHYRSPSYDNPLLRRSSSSGGSLDSGLAHSTLSGHSGRGADASSEYRVQSSSGTSSLHGGCGRRPYWSGSTPQSGTYMRRSNSLESGKSNTIRFDPMLLRETASTPNATSTGENHPFRISLNSTTTLSTCSSGAQWRNNPYTIDATFAVTTSPSDIAMSRRSKRHQRSGGDGGTGPQVNAGAEDGALPGSSGVATAAGMGMGTEGTSPPPSPLSRFPDVEP